VCNVDHGNHEVESSVKFWARFTLGSRVSILSAALTVSYVLYGLPFSEPVACVSAELHR
jgi:hypothetical protein